MQIIPHIEFYSYQLIFSLQNEAPDLTPSESCQSSDEDSDVGAAFTLENHAPMMELATASHVDAASSPASSQVPLIEHLEITVNNDMEKSTEPVDYNTRKIIRLNYNF